MRRQKASCTAGAYWLDQWARVTVLFSHHRMSRLFGVAGQTLRIQV